jgi:DNA invertase Pin-like site-specific DNA recombinase
MQNEDKTMQKDHATPPARRAALYTRVSTNKQEGEAQKSQCTMYAAAEALPIHHQIEDTASGALAWRHRRLVELIDPPGQFTDLIVYEYSRLGRDMVDTLEFLKTCHEAGLNVHIAKNKTVVRADIGGKVMATVMTLAAEIERDLLRSRTKDALADRKRLIAENGGFISKAGNWTTSLGRQPGSVTSHKLAAHADELARLFAAKTPAAAIGRLFDCDARTVKAARARWQKAQK